MMFYSFRLGKVRLEILSLKKLSVASIRFDSLEWKCGYVGTEINNINWMIILTNIWLTQK